MLLTWMAYATLIGALAGAAALALDALALRRAVATRFIWLSALVVAVVVPAFVGLRAPHYDPAQRRVASSTSTVAAKAASRSAPTAAPRRPRLGVRVLVLLLKADAYSGRLWLAASLAYLVMLLRAAIAIRRRRRQWQSIDVGGMRVLVSPDIGPAVIGAIRPCIVLPHWSLSIDPSPRALMLRHELEHIAARDPALLAAAVFINALLPWNAAVWAIARRLRLAIEIDCDRRVIAEVAGAREYGELLLSVGSRGRTPFLFVASLAERRGFLEQRIKAMTPSPSRHPRILAAALVLLAVAITTAAVRAPRPAPLARRAAGGADSLTVAELRALLLAHQPDALIAATGINTVTVLLDANGNYVTSVAEKRVVTPVVTIMGHADHGSGGRGGRGGAQHYVVAGELSTRDAGIVLSDGRGAPGGRARGNVRDGFPADSFPAPPARITKSLEGRQVDPVTGDTVRSLHVSSLSMLNGDTVILAIRDSLGETGLIQHAYITLDGPIGAGEIFGFDENVLGNLVSLQQVASVHAHAYASGEVAEQRLNVFVVRLKP